MQISSDESVCDKNKQTEQSLQPTVTQMKTKIVYLPPFLHYSYQNVPSSATIANVNVNVNFNVNANKTDGTTTNASDGGSCCRWVQQQQQQQQQQEHQKQPHRKHQHQDNGIVKNIKKGRKQRERHRNFHIQCVSLPNRQNVANNVPSSATIMTSAARQRFEHHPVHLCKDKNIQQESSMMERDDIHQINDEHKLKSNSHVDDKLINNLRNPQLIVMPIENEEYSRLDNMADDWWYKMTMTKKQCWWSDGSHKIPDTDTNTNNSQTTTLECRCFKKNGDILLKKDYEGNCKVQQQTMCMRMNTANIGMKTTNSITLPSSSQATSATATATATLATRTYNKISSQPTLRQLWQQTPLRSQVEKTFAASKWLLILVMLMLTNTAECWAGRQDSATNCTFPVRWEGSWFLSGYQQSIHIKGSEFSYRGKCAASDGNKYLIVDEKGCHRCLVIYEKHKNVLQYKESECEGDSMYMHQLNPSAMAMHSVLKQSDHRGVAHPNLNGHSRLSSSDQYIMRSNDDMNDYFCKGRETLQTLCDQIPGDALLYSLFRESAEPVKCPLKGPFIFTYNRGHGECKSPLSNIDSCTEDSRLLLSFQACPDVQGTESTVEELTCLATWKDGNSRYLVGLVSHHHAISNEERYRCFVYEKINPMMGGPSIITSKDAEYKLAQSGDATCNGLDSAEVGSRIMSLRKPPLTERCDFPVWFKGPRHWHALMGNALYSYHTNDGSIHIIKSSGYMETRALCEQINKQTSTEMMAVVHYTTGCQSGFMCMMFYRRDIHVIEIQTGKPAFRLEDACAPDHFDTAKLPYLTLLASNPDLQECPMEGLYNLRGAIGPPYLATRHKRNHNNNNNNNNKVHAGHGHHHLNEGGGGGSSVSGSGINSRTAYNQKRHSTLSFRNADRIETGVWHANTRGLQGRNRRAAAGTKAISRAGARANADAVVDANADADADGGHGMANTISSSPTHSISSSVSVADKSNIVESTTVPNIVSHTQMAMLMPMDTATATTTIISNIIQENTTTSTVSNATSMHILTPTAYEHHQHQHHHHHNHLKNSTITTRITDSAYESTALTARQRRRRNAPGCITNYKAQRQLWVGCTERNVIDVRPMCTDEGDEEYSCHGSWTENSTVYIIARHKGTKHGVCITYRPTEGTSAKLVIGDACYRSMQQQPPPEHHLVANLSIFGKCGETGSASQQIAIIGCLATLAVAISTNIIMSALVFKNR